MPIRFKHTLTPDRDRRRATRSFTDAIKGVEPGATTLEINATHSRRGTNVTDLSGHGLPATVRASESDLQAKATPGG